MLYAEKEKDARGLLIVIPKVSIVLVIIWMVKQCDPLLVAGLSATEEELLGDAY
jgi:hypothetical protein